MSEPTSCHFCTTVKARTEGLNERMMYGVKHKVCPACGNCGQSWYPAMSLQGLCCNNCLSKACAAHGASNDRIGYEGERFFCLECGNDVHVIHGLTDIAKRYIDERMQRTAAKENEGALSLIETEAKKDEVELVVSGEICLTQEAAEARRTRRYRQKEIDMQAQKEVQAQDTRKAVYGGLMLLAVFGVLVYGYLRLFGVVP